MNSANNNAKRKSLGRQIIVRFCAYSLFISAFFIMCTFLIAYTVEDEFIYLDMVKQMQAAQAHFQQTGQWPTLEDPSYGIYQSTSNLPDDLKSQLGVNPQQKEFYGMEGRHYHVLYMDESRSVLLVAEVSKSLVIRPIRGAIFWGLVISGLVLTLFAALLAYGIARRSVKPLTRLAESVESARPETSPGEFAKDCPNNEIGTLAQVLEQSFTRIANFIKREQQFNRDVSHDLRTPIAVVSSSIQLLKKNDLPEPDKAALIERIDVANRHMELTVSALLSLAREKGSDTDNVQINVLSVIEQCVLQLHHLLDEKQVALDISVPPQTQVTLPKGVLDILLSNLLANAFQYTEQGQVSVSWQENRLSVTDTAGGVPEALKATLFESYQKGENSSGFGLGLSIVKRLCEYHGISLQIEHLENGTCIMLTFHRN